MILKGKKVTLRPIEISDLAFIKEMVNDPYLESQIVGWAWPVSQKDQEQWFSSFRNSDKIVRYIIETAQQEVIGLADLRDLDWKNGSISIGGIRIGHKDCRSKGYGTDTYMTLLKHAFEDLRLHRVSTSALANNTASLKMMEKTGFKREGTVRECVYKSGTYHDKIVLGCLKSDYEALCFHSKYWE